jgi:hypothetical protein
VGAIYLIYLIHAYLVFGIWYLIPGVFDTCYVVIEMCYDTLLLLPHIDLNLLTATPTPTHSYLGTLNTSMEHIDTLDTRIG